MWDNPRLLNVAANFFVGLAALLFAFSGLQLFVHSPLFPLKEIVVQGAPKNVAAAEIQSAVGGIGGNFFAADLAAIRARLEKVPWVRHVDVRRVWPDRIEVSLEEHVALARWGQAVGDLQSIGLVNTSENCSRPPCETAAERACRSSRGPRARQASWRGAIGCSWNCSRRLARCPTAWC